ncbi:NIF family HAD-type phosphatase [Hymenobacter jeollabukensis]|nr:HAD family hydrolase [Hymenobacter jeollabukensis]
MSSDSPNQILLILDLDETLVHARSTPLPDRPADFELFDYHIYLRPHLAAFLREVNRHFKLAVWSSASDDYVTEITRRIFPPDASLEFVWGRSRCTYCFNHAAFEETGYTDYHSHYDYVKVLKKLKRHGYRLERVLIVDDTPHKAKRNFGNAIYPTEYTGQLHDNELPQLLAYLLTLKDAANVRQLEKRGWRDHS